MFQLSEPSDRSSDKDRTTWLDVSDHGRVSSLVTISCLIIISFARLNKRRQRVNSLRAESFINDRICLRGQYCSTRTLGELRGQYCSSRTLGELRGQYYSSRTLRQLRGQYCSTRTLRQLRGQYCSTRTVGELRGQYCCTRTLEELRGQYCSTRTLG